MKKLSKKTTLLAVFSALTLTLTACSTTSNQSNNTTNSSSQNNSNSETKTETTPKADELFTKILEQNKKINSTDFTTKTSVDMTSDGQNLSISVDLKGTTIVNPLSSHISGTFTSPSSPNPLVLDMYIKDSTMYMNNPQDSSTWLKTPITSENAAMFKTFSDSVNTDKTLESYKKLADSFTVTSEGDNYILTYTGTDDKFKTILAESMAFLGQESVPTDEQLKKVDFKNINIKYVVSKKDFTLISNETTMEVLNKEKAGNTLKLMQNTMFSNTNKTTEITIPEDITKNAISVD